MTMPELPYHIEVEETSDGSNTLFIPELNEHYHSIHGARTESQYIFIEHALEARLSDAGTGTGEECRVLEIGFGTGLNAILTYLYMEAHHPEIHLTYHTYEKYPIAPELIPSLFAGELSPDELSLCARMHEAEWDEPIDFAPFFTLHKHLEDAAEASLPPYDVLYMDAFSPENAPTLWSDPFLSKLTDAAQQSAVLSTYCAKGVIRRTLKGMGWDTVRTPGPPGGKREILTAHRD